MYKSVRRSFFLNESLQNQSTYQVGKISGTYAKTLYAFVATVDISVLHKLFLSPHISISTAEMDTKNETYRPLKVVILSSCWCLTEYLADLVDTGAE